MLAFRRPELSTTQYPIPPIIVLVHEGLNVSPCSEDEPYPIFHIETYATISKNQSRGAGDSILRHINDILALFSVDEQLIIYEYFSTAKRLISKMDAETQSLQQTTDVVSDMTTILMRKLSFPERIMKFVEQHVPLPNLDYVGTAAHYTNDYSFYAREYYDTTTMCMLCKFLCPLWGEFIFRTKQTYHDESNDKEILLLDERNNKELFCVVFLLPTLENSLLSFTYDKLHKYLRNTIKQVIKTTIGMASTTQPPIDFVMARYGYDDRRFEDYVYAMLLVKRIVGFDPWQVVEDGKVANIITNINMVITKTAATQLKRMRDETRIMTRNEISDSGPEQDSVSYVENMARISSTTADVPLAIVFGVRMQIPRLLKQFDIPLQQYEEALFYYKAKFTQPSVFNMAILASLHSNWIGGSLLLRYLDFTTYLQLLVVSQLYLLKIGQVQLALYLTCKTQPTQLAMIRTEGQRIRNNLKTTTEYRLVVEDRYPGTVEKKSFSGNSERGSRQKRELIEKINIVSQLEKLQNWIIDYNHIVELPSVIWETLPPEWKLRAVQDEVFFYDEQVIRELCGFFLSQPIIPTTPVVDKRTR